MTAKRDREPDAPIRAEMVEAIVSGLGDVFRYGHLHVLVDLKRSPGLEALRDAVRGTVGDFPVLARRLEPRWWRGRWVDPIDDAGDLVHLLPAEGDVDAATAAWTHREIDVLREPPLRVALLEHERGCRLIVSVHHLVSDGAGALTVTHFIAAHVVGVEPFAPAGQNRGLLQIFRSLRLRDVPTVLGELFREALRPMAILRVRLPDRSFPPGSGGDAPQWTTLALGPRRSERFALRCREEDATINDGLVATLMSLASRRTTRGPLAAAYTIDTRRYLSRRRAIVSNFAGATVVTLPRHRVTDDRGTLRSLSARIGEQKRRLPGLAYNLLPALSLGWLPQGLLRRAGRALVGTILSYLRRALVVTNIGAIDEYLAPFGDDAVSASMLGPFLSDVDTPVINATGFHGRLTLQVCSCGNLDPEGLKEYASDLETTMTR